MRKQSFIKVERIEESSNASIVVFSYATLTAYIQCVVTVTYASFGASEAIIVQDDCMYQYADVVRLLTTTS